MSMMSAAAKALLATTDDDHGGEQKKEQRKAQPPLPRIIWITGVVLLVTLLLLLVILAGWLLYTTRTSSPINKNPLSPFWPFRRKDIRIAFIGNSIQYTNDLPRFMEALSQNSITQQSCYRSATNFVDIYKYGNGMYNKWHTSNAYMNVSSSTSSTSAASSSSTNGHHVLFDYGSCTIIQLLNRTTDSHLDSYYANYNNENDDEDENDDLDDDDDEDAESFYYDNNMNPCYRDSYYYEYLKEQSQQPENWDYVVINDYTTFPALPEKRELSIDILQNVYVPLIFGDSSKSQTKLVLLSTYGYDKNLYSNDDDADDDGYDNGLGDIPEFTSRVWYGYQLYQQTLQASSSHKTKTEVLLVPSALAFLLVYEENYDAWTKLFYDDGKHPTSHGTYLLGCCLYMTIYGRIPASHNDNDISDLFARARLMQESATMGNDRPFPTADEAMYLQNIAKRVVLQHELPKSLLSFDTIAQMELYEANAKNNNNDDDMAD